MIEMNGGYIPPFFFECKMNSLNLEQIQFRILIS